MYDTFRLTGLKPVEPRYVAPHSLEAGATASPDGFAGLLHPDNPMLWFGLILAVTAGLIGGAGGVRVGKTKASIHIGKE
jgi:hypothetical protein